MPAPETQPWPPTRRQSHPFDSLAYAKSMESVGFTRQQAEKMAEEQAKLIDDRLATKEDIEALRLATRQDIEALRVDVEALRVSTKAEIETSAERIKAETKTQLAETKADLIKWVVGMSVAQAGFIVAILKLHS